MDARKTAIIVTPLVAMAALATGLRIGASGSMRAAVVYSAPPARGSNVLAWQVQTILDDRGAREAIAISDLVVTARHGKNAAEWRGASNGDGIAETRLDLPGVRPGDEVWLDVRSGEASLAKGRAEWGPAWNDIARSTWVRTSPKDGAIQLDVAPLGGKLAVGFPGSVWVRATDRATGKPLSGVALEVEPEPGLEVTTPHLVTCGAGWAEIVATPTFHVVGMSLHAKKDGADGLWYGGLPVAGGASHVAVPMRIAPAEGRSIDVIAAGTRGAIYAEVDDGSGRAFAQVLAAPRGTLDLPPLGEGIHWIVTSNEPRGAESLGGSAVAQPVLVGKITGDACETGALLAQSSATGFPRHLALDGLAGRREAIRTKDRLGVTIGLAALAVAAALETLLVLGSVRRMNADLPAAFTRRSPVGSVAIGLLAALLGFALLAALLLYRTT